MRSRAQPDLPGFSLTTGFDAVAEGGAATTSNSVRASSFPDAVVTTAVQVPVSSKAREKAHVRQRGDLPTSSVTFPLCGAELGGSKLTTMSAASPGFST